MNNKKQSLAETHTYLCEEWHPTRNGDLTPSEVTAGSHKKAFWICRKDHTHVWEANIYNRTNANKPRGCPYCSNQKLNSQNCLANVNPLLAKEWCYELNDLTPDNVQAGGKQIVWWKCNVCSHQWQAQIYERNKGHYSCPKCKSFAYKFPNLMNEWNWEKNINVNPYEINKGSHQKVWWKCPKCGFEWQASAEQKAMGRSKCKKCNSIAMTHPELAKEWHPKLNGELTTFDVSFGSNKIVHWQCGKNQEHVWASTVNGRSKECIYCAKGRNTSVVEVTIFMAFKGIFPEILHRPRVSSSNVEVDIFHPKYNFAIEYDSFTFHKDGKKQSNDEKKNRILQEDGINLIRIREEPLPEINAYGSANISYNRAKNIDTSFKKICEILLCWYSKIPGFTEAINQIDKIDLNWINSKAISFLSNIPEQESLAYIKPHLIQEWHPTKNHGLTPWDFLPYSNKKVWWRCKSKPQHEWEATITHRSSGRGCPYCNGRGIAFKMSPEKLLINLFPEIAAEWHPALNEGINLNEVYAFSTQKVWWQCAKGHYWKTPVAKRTIRKSGCHYCTNYKAWIDP